MATIGIKEFSEKYRNDVYFNNGDIFIEKYHDGLNAYIEKCRNNYAKINFLDEKYVTPYFSTKISYKQNDRSNRKKVVEKPKENFFIIGDVFTLKKEESEDFSMPSKKYKLIGIVNSVNGVNLDSVIMKQIEGENDLIFSLSKIDCKIFNINFEVGLQLFPKKLGWVNLSLLERKNNSANIEVKEEVKNDFFDPCDLSTYPTCISDKTIRHMMIKISNCELIYSGSTCIGVKLPNGIVSFGKNLRLRISIKDTLTDDNGIEYFKYCETIPYKIMTKEVSVCNISDIVDAFGCIYVELNFTKPLPKIFGLNTIDGLIGINPKILKNKSINDIIAFYTNG